MAKYKLVDGKLQLVEGTKYVLKDGKLTSSTANTTTNTNTSSNTQANPSVLGTLGFLAGKVGSGVLSGAESLVDLGTGALGTVFNSQKLKDYTKRNLTQETLQGLAGGYDSQRGAQQLQKAEDKSYAKSGGLAAGVAEGVGQLGAMVGTGTLLGGASGIKLGSKLSIPVAPMLTGSGRGFETAIKEDKDALSTFGYALGSGAVEAGTETLFGGLKIPGAKGPLDDVIESGIKNSIKSGAGQKIAKIAYNVFGEGTEEVLSSIGDKALRKINSMSEVKQDYVNDFLIGGILGGMFGTSNVQGQQTNIMKVLEELDGKSDTETQQALDNLVKLDISEIDTSTPAGQMYKKVVQDLVDKGRPFKKLTKLTGNQQIESLYDLSLAYENLGQFEIGYKDGNKFIGHQRGLKGENIGPSLTEIFDPIEQAGLKAEYDAYIKNLHNIDRVKNKINTGIPVENSQKIINELSQKYPSLKKVTSDLQQYNKNSLAVQVQAGLKTQKAVDNLLKKYPNYIRLELENDLNQNYETNAKDGKVKDIFQSAIEGEFDTKNVQEAMASQAIRIQRAITQNQLANEMAKHTDLIKDNGEGVLTFYQNGKQNRINVGNDIIKALQPAKQGALSSSAVGETLQKIAMLRKQVLTSKNPLFAFRNFFKDIPDGAINSKHTAGYMKNFPVALEAIFNKNSKNRAIYERFLAMGGGAASIFDTKTGKFNAEKGVVGKGLDKIEQFNNLIEHGPRLSEFMASLEAGDTIETAARNAAEITVNFKRGGDVTKAIDKNGALFLNASVQGFDKFVRNFIQEPSAKKYVGLLAKVFLVGMLPEIFNNLMYGDDEEWANISTDTKDKNYLFKKADGTFLKIPKGRAQSVFSKASRRVLNGKEEDETGFSKFAIEQVGPSNPLDSNIFAPITQLATNKNFFGSDIVPMRLQDELPKNQYDESTDIISKKIGETLNWSPKKINYVIDQYSGIIGDIVLPPLTPKAEPRLIEKTFGLDPAYADKNVSLFYDLQQSLTESKNGGIATDKELQQLKNINSAAYNLNELWALRRAIQESDLSYDEKRAEARKVQLEINKFTEDVVKNNK